VQGSVLDPSGKQLTGVLVTFYPEGKGDPIPPAPVGVEAHFNLLCPPGDYKVTVQSMTAPNIGRGPAGTPSMAPPGVYVIPMRLTRPSSTDLKITIPPTGDPDLTIHLPAN
jgi:hypothetical protein